VPVCNSFMKDSCACTEYENSLFFTGFQELDTGSLVSKEVCVHRSIYIEDMMALTPSCVSKVTACLSSYFELRPCRPRLEKLKHLLAECPYRGPEYEEGGELVEGEAEREEGGQPKRRKMPQKVSSLKIKSFCQYLFSITSRKTQLRAPLSPLQTAWTGFDPDLYSGGSFSAGPTLVEIGDD